MHFFKNIFLVNIFNLRVFFDPQYLQFLPLTAEIRLEIYYWNELENRSDEEVSLMTINDTFSIGGTNLDKKNL